VPIVRKVGSESSRALKPEQRLGRMGGELFTTMRKVDSESSRSLKPEQRLG